MTPARLQEISHLYKQQLLENVVPFWLKHFFDMEQGGFFTYIDREGGIYCTDKSTTMHARAIWMLSRLCTALGTRSEWLDAAKHGFDFLLNRGFDDEGRMLALVTRDGRPLKKSVNVFPDLYGVMAFAEYGRATGSEQSLGLAREMYKDSLERIKEWHSGVDGDEARPTQSHAVPMLLLSVTQVMMLSETDAVYGETAQWCVDKILKFCSRSTERALLETVGRDGERLATPEGRLMNIGHSFESAWFVMQEGVTRKDQKIIEGAELIIQYALERGWDTMYGGLTALVDVEGKPLEQPEADMKLWWVHTEALYALLLAYSATGKDYYSDWYEKVHQWTFAHFPDAVNGEWYGYLHQDGTVAKSFKGGTWKGMFHVPRTLLLGTLLLGEKKK